MVAQRRDRWSASLRDGSGAYAGEGQPKLDVRTRSSAARPAGPHVGLPPGRPRSPFWPIRMRNRLFRAANPRPRRIAGEHVTEIDHARERPVRDDDIRGMEVTVQPYRRALPLGGRNGIVPD